MNRPSPQVELVLGLRAARLVRKSLALEALSNRNPEDKLCLRRLVEELDEKIRRADVHWVSVQVLDCGPTGDNNSGGNNEG